MILSRLRAFLLIDPLIVAATVIMGTLSLIASLFDPSGRVPRGKSQGKDREMPGSGNRL